MDEQPAATPMILKYFLLLFLISMLLLLRLLWPLLSIVLLSFLLASIFQPVYTFFNRKLSAPFSSLLTCVLIVLLVFLPLLFFVGALSKEAFDLYQIGKGTNLTVILKDLLQKNPLMIKFQEVLEMLGLGIQPHEIGKIISGFIKSTGLFLFNRASAWATNIMLFIFNFFIMIITIYFLLIDHERLINFILRLSPLPDDQERQLIRKFKKIAGAVLVGNGICGLIQGVLGGLAFWIFDLGSPIIWGGVMLILAFLPIFGIGLVLIPAALIIILKGNIAGGLYMLIFYAFLSFSVEYFLKPKLVSQRIQMHTLLVFLAIIGGLSVFGFLGIIYGPLIITAFLTLSEIYLANYDKYIKSGECKG